MYVFFSFFIFQETDEFRWSKEKYDLLTEREKTLLAVSKFNFSNSEFIFNRGWLESCTTIWKIYEVGAEMFLSCSTSTSSRIFFFWKSFLVGAENFSVPHHKLFGVIIFLSALQVLNLIKMKLWIKWSSHWAISIYVRMQTCKTFLVFCCCFFKNFSPMSGQAAGEWCFFFLSVFFFFLNTISR